MTDVLFITNSYRSFIKDQIELISEQLNHVYVLVRYNPIAEISRFIPSEELKNHRKRFQIDLTNTPGNVRVIVLPLLYLPTDSGYKKLGKKHFKAVQKAIQKNKIEFDLIHAHFAWSSGYAAAKLKERYSVPFIVTTHGYDIYDLPFRNNEWKVNVEYVLNRADQIITVSNSNLECIKKINVKKPVSVIANGFLINSFYPRSSKECRKKLNLPLDKRIILTVGILDEVKGHRYLIEAMQEIVKKRKDIICIIVGGGGLRNRLLRQVKKAGLQNTINLVGMKEHSEVPTWISACDLFVLPSLSEGNPTVMFECLGCGKPFIGTKVGGIPEVITSEDYGILVEPANSEALAESLFLALEKNFDKDKILKYSKQFAWEEIVKQIVSIYDYVLRTK